MNKKIKLCDVLLLSNLDKFMKRINFYSICSKLLFLCKNLFKQNPILFRKVIGAPLFFKEMALSWTS